MTFTGPNPERGQADLALVGGRVVDPETRLDAPRSVGVSDGRITAVIDGPLRARSVVDISGLVLAPGFIDLHSHAQSLTGQRLHALDGVTTALDLEAGRADVPAALRAAADQGRPINFGFSAGWAAVRARLTGDDDHGVIPAGTDWMQPWDGTDLTRLLDAVETTLHEGAIGIGILLGYAPGTARAEYLELARMAARHQVPTFTHARFISHREPNTSVEAILEVIAASAATGAHMHICHLHSTSNRQIDLIAGAVDTARRSGARLSAEAYPYGSAATSISAPFLDPVNLPRLGITPSSIIHLRTGQRVASEAQLRELRRHEPMAKVVFDWADESTPYGVDLLTRSFLLPDTAFASDSMEVVREDGTADPYEWPLQPGGLAHPRSLGTFAKVIRWLVRDRAVLDLPEALRRCSLVPAQILQDAVPALRAKARVQVGCDADLIAFDPGTISDRASLDEPIPSSGITHVLVDGQFVVRDGVLDPAVNPGRPITGTVAAGRRAA